MFSIASWISTFKSPSRSFKSIFSSIPESSWIVSSSLTISSVDPGASSKLFSSSSTFSLTRSNFWRNWIAFFSKLTWSSRFFIRFSRILFADASILYFLINFDIIFLEFSLKSKFINSLSHKFAPYDKKFRDFSSSSSLLLEFVYSDIFLAEPRYFEEPNNSTLAISNSLKIILAGRVSWKSLFFLWYKCQNAWKSDSPRHLFKSLKDLGTLGKATWSFVGGLWDNPVLEEIFLFFEMALIVETAASCNLSLLLVQLIKKTSLILQY